VYPKTKIVLYQQMQFGLDKRDPIHSWMHSKLSLWITVTDRMKEEVLNHTRVAAERITVVPVGIDVRSYDPDRYDKIQARKFFDLPEDAAIVGTLSRLDPKKGIEDLLRAVPLVVERNKSVLLAIAGDETKGQVGYKDYLLRLCNDLGIDTHVRFLPFTSEVSRYLAALDLFILPSHSETFGFALIEAMAMRRAVIATDAGGVPEIVEHGKCGLLVPPQNSVRLSEAINSLLDDPEYRLELGKRARKRVVEAFDSEICVERFLASLDSLSPVRKGKLKEIGIFAWLLANQATYIIGGSTNLFTN
jgi:glycosyltransferase involved in cell wall biosynthesis